MEFSGKSFYGVFNGVKDAAWRIHIENKISSLPVSVMRICKNMGIDVLSYDEAGEMIKYCRLEGIASVNSGFVLYTDKWYILYSPNIIPEEATRFILARELSRILLGHPMETIKVGYFTAYYSNEVLNTKLEKEVETFAGKILAPACVLRAIEVFSASDIEQVCGLSPSEAERRANRMIELGKRNKFFTNPLEDQVFSQFFEFIKKHSQERVIT